MMYNVSADWQPHTLPDGHLESYDQISVSAYNDN